MTPSPEHIPVLADEVARLAGGVRRAVDATAGLGGHVARLRSLGVEILAIDRDVAALELARERLGERGITWVQGRFGDPAVLEAMSRFRPELILLDLGVSSLQLDRDERGFSFRPGVALDMRMGGAAEGPSAADLLNRLDAASLTDLFGRHADEPRARRLARAIERRRDRQPFHTADDLVNAIRSALGPRSGPSDFARIFQAVRIAVNDELTQLTQALPAMRDALPSGGRLAVISYHSGEDRIVKRCFREWAQRCVCPPRQPVCTCRGRALGRVEPRRPIVPTSKEVASNPRARSAKLRVFVTDGEA